MKMDDGGRVVRCPQCNRPYRVYDMTTKDQSLCPGCSRDVIKELEDAEKRGYPHQESK